MAWQMYDALIAGVTEEAQVVDYGLGLNWSWVQAECGCGLSYTTRGGALRGGKRDLRGRSLREVAALAKSWCFEDASLGVAALNAWYSQREAIDALAGANVIYEEARSMREQVDPFDALRPQIAAMGGQAHVVVVGHFPHVEEMGESAQLTVLERNCRSECDTPDPACEYVIPGADFVFLTGVTLMNKTAPRLLELARASRTIMVGPSAIPARPLFDAGADAIGGRVVVDPEKVRFCCATREAFGDALLPFLATKGTLA